VVVVVEGRVVVVGVARCVVVVTRSVVVVAGGTVVVVVVVVLLVVVAGIVAELFAALDEGWLAHAAVVNATAVTAHTKRANRRGRGVVSPRGTWICIATPPRPSLDSAGTPRRIRSSTGAVRGQ
jgi:hypothetical protein